ncbi:MAG TPA: peptide chain release factor N(5)-glutamine methyltransferase [Candidatus Omnitrophica bacterium]|nr:peptide chain release factor N(5)-glutamine methyltransferase [Candidatus Omnitrophota bacterium]
MKIKNLIDYYSQELGGYSSYALTEVEEIFLSALGLEQRSALYLNDFQDIPFEVLDSAIEKRKQGYPLQYLTGRVNFFGFDFITKEGVFIPRPETELLVEYVVSNFKAVRGLKIVEVGTGSGIISICLTKLLADCKIIATDISIQAIGLASANALLNGCRDEILFIKGDKTEFLHREGYFDLLVSNPPYIALSEKHRLPKDVKKEPHQALFGGSCGYEFSLDLIRSGSKLIKPGGSIIIEIDQKHKSVYEKSFSGIARIDFIKDIHGLDRVMALKF